MAAFFVFSCTFMVKIWVIMTQIDEGSNTVPSRVPEKDMMIKKEGQASPKYEKRILTA